MNVANALTRENAYEHSNMKTFFHGKVYRLSSFISQFCRRTIHRCVCAYVFSHVGTVRGLSKLRRSPVNGDVWTSGHRRSADVCEMLEQLIRMRCGAAWSSRVGDGRPDGIDGVPPVLARRDRPRVDVTSETRRDTDVKSLQRRQAQLHRQTPAAAEQAVFLPWL